MVRLNFTFTGKGTPTPHDPPKELVVQGFYRLTRNPMYVGVSLVLFGESIQFESLLLFVYAVLVIMGFHLRVVYYEEPALRRKFGKSYGDYCRAVALVFARLIRAETDRHFTFCLQMIVCSQTQKRQDYSWNKHLD